MDWASKNTAFSHLLFLSAPDDEWATRWGIVHASFDDDNNLESVYLLTNELDIVRINLNSDGMELGLSKHGKSVEVVGGLCGVEKDESLTPISFRTTRTKG